MRGIFFALALLILAPEISSAMHIIGGEITYVCLGDAPNNSRRYRFTMKIYRDCLGFGADYDDPAEMAIFQGLPNASNYSLYQAFKVPGPVISPIPPVPPPCISSIPSVCVQQAIYTFERTLPILQAESYYIVYQRCCRNVTITNIISPGDIGATYMVELTAAAQNACNNSPVFKNFPPVIICKDFALSFDHSATDADGDQLVYDFVAPLQGGGPLLQPQSALFSCNGAKPTPPCAPPFNNVPFVVPTYTPGAPMGGNPVVSINSVTGLITGIPKIQGQFVVGVRVREYRNGVLLSEVRRDFQFNVADCQPTVLANIETDSFKIVGPKKFAIKSCGENTVKFINKSIDPAKITSFEWQFLNNNTVFFSDKQNWSPTVTFPGIGQYTGTLVLNPGLQCGDTARIEVNIFPKVTASFTFDYDTCEAGPVVFTDQSFGDGNINLWDWRFGVPGGQSIVRNPAFQYPYPGDHPVRLRVSDANKCSDDTVRVVQWFPAPPIIIVEPNTFLGCAPADIFFNNLSFPIDSTYHIVWNFGDGTGVKNVISPRHLYPEPGVYDVSVAITSPIGCFISDSFPNLIRVEPSPTADFEMNPDKDLTNFNNTVQFTDKSSGAAHWNWQLDKYKTSLEQNPVFTFPDTGLMKVRLIVTHAKGCKDSLTKYLDIRPVVLWHMPNAFTPNGDGLNDGFLGKGYMEGATNFRMTIWNRWGELVFETSNPNDEWNGRVQNTGGMSPAGVYVYIVTFTGPRGEPFEFKGFATLVK